MTSKKNEKRQSCPSSFSCLLKLDFFPLPPTVPSFCSLVVTQERSFGHLVVAGMALEEARQERV